MTLRKKHLFGALLSTSLMMPIAAAAQEAAAAAKQESPAKTGDEIIVTAQGSKQLLLETPVSIGVLGGERLETGSQRAVADVLRQVAGVSVTAGRPGATVIAIRGVQPAAGTSTVGYYQDDVPFAFIRTAVTPDASTFDIDRVEVLRGTQGTLYGVGSLTGVVRIITNDANLDDFEVKGRGRISDTERGGTNYGGDLAVSVPLIPGTLAIRAVAGYSNADGFITSSRNGKRGVNDLEATNYRVKMTFAPTDDFSLKLGYQRAIVNVGATDDALDNFTNPFLVDRPIRQNLNIYNAQAEYTGGGIAFKSITSFVDYKMNSIDSIPGVDSYIFDNNLTSFAQEVRLSSDSAGPWKWQIGGIYKHTKEFNRQDARPVFTPGISQYDSRSVSYAVFGDVTRDLFDDRLEISGGLRYYSDDVVLNQQGHLFAVPALITNKKSHYDKLTGRVVLTYKPSDSAMFYATYGSGFRSGLQQTPSALLSAPLLGDAAPDTIDNYEVGAKGKLFGGMLTYEAAVYFMKFSGPQQGLRVTAPGGVPLNGVVNAGDADGWGAEAALTFKPSRALSLSGSLGWNGLAFREDISTLSGTTPVILFRKGDRLNDSAEWTLNASADYETPVSDTVNFFATADVNYTTGRTVRFLIGGVSTSAISDRLTMASAQLGIRVGGWQIGLFGENLFNEAGAINGRNSGLQFVATRLRPRTLGLQASFKY